MVVCQDACSGASPGPDPGYASPRMVIALSTASADVGLIVVFFVIFPILAQGLIAFAIAQVFGERAENQRYAAGLPVDDDIDEHSV